MIGGRFTIAARILPAILIEYLPYSFGYEPFRYKLKTLHEIRARHDVCPNRSRTAADIDTQECCTHIVQFSLYSVYTKHYERANVFY